MKLNEITRASARASAKRIGRGGKRGKTSGRGMKGQLARAGNSTRPEMREIIKKIPKLRGHGVNRARTVVATRAVAKPVNLSVLEARFENGEEVTPRTLVAKGALRMRAGRAPLVKILAEGELSKKLTVSGCKVSATAKEAIEKAGGTVA